MLQLSDFHHDCLRRIVRAGSVELGEDCPLSVGLMLQIGGLVTITESRPQRAQITAKGRAFSQRGAFA